MGEGSHLQVYPTGQRRVNDGGRAGCPGQEAPRQGERESRVSQSSSPPPPSPPPPPRETTTTTGLWKAGWGACNREALAGAHWAEGEPASSGNLGGGGAPDVLHMLGPGSRQRNVAAERCQERPWGRACNPPRSKDPDLPGRGSQRSRPPLPLPPSPSGKPPHPVAETPRHSLCSRSHSADVCRDPSEDQAPQTACTVSEGSVWGGPAAGPGRGASQGTADTQQVQDPGLRRSPVQGAGVSRALTA